MSDTIRETLNKAIDDGNIALADQLSAKLAPGEIPPIPEDFVQTIENLSAQRAAETAPLVNGKRPRRFRRRPVILAAALVLLLAFTAVVYATGLLWPAVGFKDGTAATVNAAMDSNEYKAARDYASYLNRHYKELEYKVFDPIDYPIYADTAKVKELSEKYHLNYATKRTDLKSLEEVKAALKDGNIPDFLGTALTGAKPESVLFDDETAFTFNDGNFYMQYSRTSNDENQGNIQVEVAYTPKGTFPWSGFCLSPGQGRGDLNQDQAFTYTSKGNRDIVCVPGVENGKITSYTCFAGLDDGYVTISLFREVAEAADKLYDSKCKTIDKKYAKKVERALGISLEQLQDRVVSQWKEAAWDKDYHLMEKASLASTDPKEAAQLEAQLEAKYGTATATEKQLYKEWQDSLDACSASIDWSSPVSRDDLSSLLKSFSL